MSMITTGCRTCVAGVGLGVTHPTLSPWWQQWCRATRNTAQGGFHVDCITDRALVLQQHQAICSPVLLLIPCTQLGSFSIVDDR
jgi:hypothetical protein